MQKKETQIQIIAYCYLLSIYYMLKKKKNQTPFPDEEIASEMPSYLINVMGHNQDLNPSLVGYPRP